MVLHLLISFVVMLGVGFASYENGLSTGRDLERGVHDGQTVKAMTEQLRESHALAVQANQTSLAVQAALTRQAALNTTTTDALKNALARTADSRVHCVLDADSLRQLTAARDRAAQAATGSVARAVPAAERPD